MIRPADPEDAAAISMIFAHYVESTNISFAIEPPTEVAWRERIGELHRTRHPFIVAEAAHGVVGYAYASPWRRGPAYARSVETSIYLDPSAHRRGHGAALLDHLIDACDGRGYRTMLAIIADVPNPASVRLHRSRGFDEVGTLREIGHKNGSWIDTLIMQRLVTERADDR